MQLKKKNRILLLTTAPISLASRLLIDKRSYPNYEAVQPLGALLDTFWISVSRYIIALRTARPEEVNIGALFGMNTTIGKVAKVAIQAAVDDVNSSPSVLNGTTLIVTMQDTILSGFIGIVQAMTLLEKNVVAIVGPQSSVVAHAVSYLAKGQQVPLVSFAATDPTLSSLGNPFFVRTSQNDFFQMTAIADIVDYFGWKKVTAIFTDDDFGRNGIATLEDKLTERQCTISYRASMNPDPSREDIKKVLFEVILQESRILVVHSTSNHGPSILEVARSLHMLESGYVWIVTDWLTNILDSDSPLSSSALSDVQGLLTLRLHTPQSEPKKRFMSRWKNLIRKENVNNSFRLNTYGLLAYDTVWVVAHALDEFFHQGGNISFSNSSILSQLGDSKLRFDEMRVFDGGEALLSNVRQVKMAGLTGDMEFDSDRNLINPAYDIVNVVGTGHVTIGYWSNSSGLSVKPPETALSRQASNLTSSSQQLHSVVWPGNTIEKPRGWVFPNNGMHLKIVVPNRIDYAAISSYSASTDSFTGYIIDVFTSAANLLPYALPYKLVPYGDGINNPDINEIIDKMSAGVFDAVLGGIPITTDRLRKADFTQPYMESGLVVVAQLKIKDSNAWAFLRPFTPMMWLTTLASFIGVGVVVWILEHRHNEDFRGPPRQQMGTILWFTLSTWFFSHQENTVSTLGRFVLIIWLFVVLIMNSSYTASLTSILTVQHLSSSVKGIQSLVASKDPIGYRAGSYVRDYLNKELNVPASRLVSLKSENESAEALRKGPKNGGVAAIVDIKGFMEVFLSTRCEFTIVGQEFTRNGWGFAFPRGSQLAVDISTAILRLSEKGDLQRIHNKWLRNTGCGSQTTQLSVNTLELDNFLGIYLIFGAACSLALVIYFGRIVKQYMRHYTPELEESPNGQKLVATRSSPLQKVQTFLSFADEKEEDIIRRSKLRQMEGSSTMSDIPRYVST